MVSLQNTGYYNCMYVIMYLHSTFRKSHNNVKFLWPIGTSLQLLSTGLNLYIFICLCDVFIVYVVKEVASFRGAQSINGCGT